MTHYRYCGFAVNLMAEKAFGSLLVEVIKDDWPALPCMQARPTNPPQKPQITTTEPASVTEIRNDREYCDRFSPEYRKGKNTST